MIMDGEVITVKKAVQILRNLKKQGKTLRGVYPVQDSRFGRIPDDFRVDWKNKNEKHYEDPDNSIRFRKTTKNTRKQLEDEIDDEIIREEWY